MTAVSAHAKTGTVTLESHAVIATKGGTYPMDSTSLTQFCRTLVLRVHLRPWEEMRVMLRWVWLFLVLAIIAAIFGFTGVVVAAAGIAKILFFVFLVVFVIGLLMGRRVVG